MNEVKKISIKDLVLLFWSHSIILIIAFIVGASAAFSYTHFAIEPEYSSFVTMYVQTYTDVREDNSNGYNDISKSKQLINTYIQVMKDPAVMKSVGSELAKQFDDKILTSNFSMDQGKVKPSSLANAITLSSVEDTSAIMIVAKTKNAELSAAVCNELCKQISPFAAEAIGVGEIKYIDTAQVYNMPVSPNIVKNTAVGGIALFMLAAFIIFIVDFYDTRIKGSEYLAKKYKKAILGEIEEVSVAKKAQTEEEVSLLSESIPFNVVESYKSMRTNITFALSTSEKKAFIVSSANPSEGKSTTAANTAIALADEGQKVLLIDADMRKPTQHKIFKVKNDRGLSSVLSKMKKFEECVQKTSVPTLSILPSGPIPPNPSELLSSEQTVKLLEKASEEYSVIVIDSPPVNVVSDTLNLSQHVAGILSVVRCGYTREADISELMNKTEMAHMNVLGFVLTRVNSKNSGRYYKRYGKYHYYKEYGYGEQPKNDKKEENKEKKKADKK